MLPWELCVTTVSLCKQSAKRILVKYTLNSENYLLSLKYSTFCLELIVVVVVFVFNFTGHVFRSTAVFNDADGRMGYCFSVIVLFTIMNKTKFCYNTVEEIIPIYVHHSLGHEDFPFNAQCIELTVTKGQTMTNL